jgi:hypothetical protein
MLSALTHVLLRTDMVSNFNARGISTSNIITSADASTGVASIAVAEDGFASCQFGFGIPLTDRLQFEQYHHSQWNK